MVCKKYSDKPAIFCLPSGVETNTAKLSDQNGKEIIDSSDQQYISTREYIKNMHLLINYIKK